MNVLGLTFGALMQNEFSNMGMMTCTDDSLIPSGPEYTDINYQVCTLAGSQAGSKFIDGKDYVAQAFSYYPGNLWRNLGIVLTIIIFFLIMNVVLGELVRFGMDGNAAKVYTKPNEECKKLNQALIEKRDNRRKDKSNEQGEALKMNSEAILTWESLNYDVPVPGGTRRLLNNVFGYVRPVSEPLPPFRILFHSNRLISCQRANSQH